MWPIKILNLHTAYIESWVEWLLLLAWLQALRDCWGWCRCYWVSEGHSDNISRAPRIGGGVNLFGVFGNPLIFASSQLIFMRYLGSDKGITFPPGWSHYFINWKLLEAIEPTGLNMPNMHCTGKLPPRFLILVRLRYEVDFYGRS